MAVPLSMFSCYDETHMELFTKNVVEIIGRIPRGNVSTYGRISCLAGRPGSARQVARILHSLSRKYDLPWHRVVNISGKISLPEHSGYYEQKAMLIDEGIVFDMQDRIDFDRFLWRPDPEWHPEVGTGGLLS